MTHMYIIYVSCPTHTSIVILHHKFTYVPGLAPTPTHVLLISFLLPTHTLVCIHRYMGNSVYLYPRLVCSPSTPPIRAPCIIGSVHTYYLPLPPSASQCSLGRGHQCSGYVARACLRFRYATSPLVFAVQAGEHCGRRNEAVMCNIHIADVL